MIAGGDDQSVVQLPGLFERGQNAAEVHVVMFNFDGVIQHVPTRLGIIRPKGGDMVDIAKFFAHS